jgi:hypothetical protein
MKLFEEILMGFKQEVFVRVNSSRTFRLAVDLTNNLIVKPRLGL